MRVKNVSVVVYIYPVPQATSHSMEGHPLQGIAWYPTYQDSWAEWMLVYVKENYLLLPLEKSYPGEPTKYC